MIRSKKLVSLFFVISPFVAFSSGENRAAVESFVEEVPAQGKESVPYSQLRDNVLDLFETTFRQSNQLIEQLAKTSIGNCDLVRKVLNDVPHMSTKRLKKIEKELKRVNGEMKRLTEELNHLSL